MKQKKKKKPGSRQIRSALNKLNWAVLQAKKARQEVVKAQARLKKLKSALTEAGGL